MKNNKSQVLSDDFKSIFWDFQFQDGVGRNKYRSCFPRLIKLTTSRIGPKNESRTGPKNAKKWRRSTIKGNKIWAIATYLDQTRNIWPQPLLHLQNSPISPKSPKKTLSRKSSLRRCEQGAFAQGHRWAGAKIDVCWRGCRARRPELRSYFFTFVLH